MLLLWVPSIFGAQRALGATHDLQLVVRTHQGRCSRA